jgi:integrase/recombinase XerD
MDMKKPKSYVNRVNVLKKVRINENWKLAPVVEKQGKIVRDHVLVSGNDEHHSEGQYYLEWYQADQRRRQSVGGFDAMLEAARRKSVELEALRLGVIKADTTMAKQPARTSISDAIARYLAFVEAHRSPRTFLTYRYTLGTLLRESYTKRYVDEVTREDILDFMNYCHNKVQMLKESATLWSPCWSFPTLAVIPTAQMT